MCFQLNPICMPVSPSAKKALRVAERRHLENLKIKSVYKKAVKSVKKAVEESAADVATLLSKAQSALDTAAKSKTIHPNKAARLKSRLAKRLATATTEAPAAKAVKKDTPKKAAGKPAAKKATKKA